MRTALSRTLFLILTAGTLLFVSLQVLAQQDDGAQADAKTPSLAKAAQSAYESTLSAYATGTIGDVDNVYRWSKRWTEAEDSPAARQSHLARMQELHRRIAALHRQDAPGGEIENYHATTYYVVEAQDVLSHP